MTNNPNVDAVLKRDRMIVLAGLAAIVLFAAIYTVNMALTYGGVPATMLRHHDAAGHGGDSFLNLFVMWAVMQVAMMSPTAVPMLLMHTKVARYHHPGRSPLIPTTLFFL